MPSDGAATRTAIMDSAESLVLQNGFAGTSIDSIIDGAGVTKGAFFHHFDSKQALAHALIGRYAELDLANLSERMERAERLQKDPLQQLLLFVGFFIEEAEALQQATAGCLMASYVYEAGLFDHHTLGVVNDSMLAWREALLIKLEEVAAVHEPVMKVDFESLADMMTVVVEGAFVVGKSVTEPAVMANQLTHYRNYLELVFGVEG